MKRAIFVLGLAALVSGGAALPALGAELADYLRNAGDAEFAARQVVITYWDGGGAAGGVYSVRQTGGMTMVESEGRGLMVGDGKMASDHGSGAGHLAVSEWSDWRLSDKYAVSSIEAALRLGRPATVVTVLEGGTPRLRMIFDDATGAPLLSEVYDGDGRLFRMVALVEFQAGAQQLPVEASAADEYEVVTSSSAVGLPETLGGYWRADTYAGPDASVQAFYTDGIFSFSVFRTDARLEAGPFASGAELEAGNGGYRRLLEPGSVRVFWNAAEGTFVLVGDLPPDHLTEVLAGLPDPDRPNLLVRAWRGLFG